MNRAEAVKIATERVMAPQLALFRKGEAPVVPERAEQWLFDQTKRRADEIARTAAEIMRGPTIDRCHCGAVATTTVQGKPYCGPHAVSAPRLERPKGR